MAGNKHRGPTLDSFLEKEGVLGEFQAKAIEEVRADSITNKDDDFELIRGTGNVYADLGMKNPEERQRRVIEASGDASKNRK
ncbi:hypothetical protein FHS79_003331 [Polymorphobacter multimanifer]|uniref:Uncharacterized protein n=1 Tax=Polymorphobacter multimanifer TaxID=1070431 RepID=A0A841L9M7_9SPHN|nr:hypothetical protein [Polymorphobacter multimanifer]MBB6229130.1 hypothetical protein [Polymorphobacter multimanifer]